MKPIYHPEHIDYIAFSAHKMYAPPFGIGVLIAPKTTFNKGHSEYVGGGTVKLVTPQDVIWEKPPQKEEAGTPNLLGGVVALIESLKILKSIGMDKISNYEKELTQYTLERIKKYPI